MRLLVASCAVSVGLAVSGCSSSWEQPAARRSLSTGSEYGNYVAQADGEMRGDAGERCVVFNWDRPLARGLAVRLRSASCESREHPGRMVCTELSRTVIPVSESVLGDEAGQARP